MIVVVQKRVIVLLFRRLNVDDFIFSTEYSGSNLYGSKPIKSDSLFIKTSCNMNAFFSFDLFMIYIPECKQQLRTMK